MKYRRALLKTNESRRGSIIVPAALLMVAILAFLAFTVDIGFIEMTRTQLQSAADAGALAGALELTSDGDAATVRENARRAVQQLTQLHANGDQSSVTINPTRDITFGRTEWNSSLQKYVNQWGEAYTPHNLIKVRTQRITGTADSGDTPLPLFFAPVLGHDTAQVSAEAIATFQPRDIMVVLDFSASMNDDSSLGAIGKLGRSAVESNLNKMWTELGAPTYGNLTFAPKYAMLRGIPAVGQIPHIDVEYRRTSIGVTSTLALSQVKLRFSNGSTETFAGLSGLTGNFSGTGSNAGKTISSCWVKSGQNGSLSSGNNGELFDFTVDNIKKALGLTGAYPYPIGSWTEFVQINQSSSNDIAAAGYRDKYGYLTWLEYLQTIRESAAETPTLWMTSEQPVGVLKDGVDAFVDYLKEVQAEDYVGLAAYTHPNAPGAFLEHGLNSNIDQVKTTTRQRQAGHYQSNTNISAGMQVARTELVNKSRPRSFRMMVVMTDGLPNAPGSVSQATQAVITEANLAKAEKIRIMTISVGAYADASLMQQVADITDGVHFNVPGGSSIDDVRTQLQNVFRQIASSRPLRLISVE